MKVYRVQTTSIGTWSSIEVYTEQTYFFTDWIKAVKFAHKQGKKLSNKNLEYNKDGEYCEPSINYPEMWGDYKVSVDSVIIDSNNELSQDGYISSMYIKLKHINCIYQSFKQIKIFNLLRNHLFYH